MKERPILFSGPMVRAILEGRKTQTRRIMKPQPSPEWAPHHWGEVHKKKRDGSFAMRRGKPIVIGWGPSNFDGSEAYPCRYGKPGDRLWVKEAHRLVDGCCCKETCHVPGHVWYEADQSGYDRVDMNRLRPSIHMPRWASRITLEITGIRVERLHDISDADAISEGVLTLGVDWLAASFPEYWKELKRWEEIKASGIKPPLGPSPRERFKALFDQINPGSWELNPWVWIPDFKRVDGLDGRKEAQ